MYRAIVKTLHPNISEVQLKLFYNAQQSYEVGDLDGLRIISVMVGESAVSNDAENALFLLTKEKERLEQLIKVINEKIAEIKNSYPYNVKKLSVIMRS